VLSVNLFVTFQLLIFAIPAWLIFRDAKATANRFGLILDTAKLSGEKESAYLDAAKKVFKDNPDVAAFVYGHTHAVSLRRLGKRAVLNTGTWIKRFEPAKVRFGLLPRVYVPSYRLSCFRVSGEDKKIVVEYSEIAKTPAQELTWLQRAMVSRRSLKQPDPIPPRTVIS